jgi:hypothetical protein
MLKKSIHVLRYGTVAEKAHLEKTISAYDYLSINGNTAAYVSSAIAKFVVDKFFSNLDKGFFIDPITYAFQNEIHLLKSKSKTTGEEKIKKSVEKLVEIFKYPADKVLNDTPINANDFLDIQLTQDFCRRVLSFQYSIVHEHITKNDLSKYLEYVMPDGILGIPQLRPKFLIAPYFYLDSQDQYLDDWLKINIDFINTAVIQAKQDFSSIDVFGQIVISKSVLRDQTKIRKIVSAYKNLDCSGFTIWVDDLNEHEATFEELKGFIGLLKAMHNKPIYNMYGGYFSILLTHKKIALLDGVSHGLEYGESRKVYPVGGGIPVSKYYYLPLHQRLDFTKAFYLLVHAKAIDTTLDNWGKPDYYYKEICNCTQCKKVINNDMINFVEFESKEFYEIRRNNQVQRRKKASSDTKENCLYHYLLCKKFEFSQVSRKSLDDLISDFAIKKKAYIACNAIQNNELNYLDIWADALLSFRG